MSTNWVNTFWWAVPNLFFPLLAIPIVMGIQWLSAKRPSFQAIIEDGQICFYSIAILAAAWYDLKEYAHSGKNIGEMDTWVVIVGGLATLGYGIMASDHVGAKTLSRDRAAVASVIIGIASIALALQVHTMVAGAVP
jgi:hypothetical protein